MINLFRSRFRLLAAAGLFAVAGPPAVHAQQPRGKPTPAVPPRAVAVAPARAAAPAAPASATRLFEVRRVVPEDVGGGEPRSYKDPATGQYSTLYLDRALLLDQSALESAKVVVINVVIRGTDAPVPSGPQGHIYLKFNENAAKRLGQITSQMPGGRLAVLVDGRLISAPTVTAPIFDKMDVTGAYSLVESKQIVNRINAVVAPGTPPAK